MFSIENSTSSRCVGFVLKLNIEAGNSSCTRSEMNFLVYVNMQMDAFDFEEEEMLLGRSVKNSEENLFDFLYKLNLHHRHPEIARILFLL